MSMIFTDETRKRTRKNLESELINVEKKTRIYDKSKDARSCYSFDDEKVLIRKLYFGIKDAKLKMQLISIQFDIDETLLAQGEADFEESELYCGRGKRNETSRK